MGKGNVVLLSDYGSAHTHTAAVTGIILDQEPGLDVYPGNIWLEPGDVRQASGVLYSTAPFWPSGTVLLTDLHRSPAASERWLALRLTNGCVALAADNGALTMPLVTLPVDQLRQVRPALLDDGAVCPAARLAARLASGRLRFDAVGEQVAPDAIHQFDLTPARVSPGLAEGSISMVMRNFGNLTCNISIEDFERTGIVSGDTVRLTVTLDGQPLFDQNVLYHRSFGFAPPKAPIVFNGSSGFMGFGLNQASFVQAYLPHIMEEGVDPFVYKVRIEKQ